MISLVQIQLESWKEARRAAREHRQPFIVEKEDLEVMPPFPFPNLGDYVPKGWEITETYFVDSSGFGQRGEPALSVDEFKDKIKVGYGYALWEVGEFQVKVREYRKIK